MGDIIMGIQRRKSCYKGSLNSLIKIAYPLGIRCCYAEVIILQDDIYRCIFAILSSVKASVGHHHVLLQ